MSRITLPLALAAAIAAGCNSKAPPASTPPAVPPAPAPVARAPVPPPQPPPEIPWTLAPGISEHGDVTIGVGKVYQGRLAYNSLVAGVLKSDEPYLAFSIGIFNNNPAKTYHYASWSEQSSGPKLTDDLGNSYPMVKLQIGRWVGQIKEATLYSGKPTGDLLVFERPVPAARVLSLILPAKNCGVTGEARFKVPVDQIGPAP